MLNGLLLENIHPSAAEALSGSGVHLTSTPGALGESDLRSALRGVHLLGIRSKTEVTEGVLSSAPDLLAVGAFCIGINQVDLDAAAERGVAVFNAPFSNTRSVVELAMGEIIALTRRLTHKSESLHQGTWDKSAKGSHEVRGRTIGIVGYGNIGSQLSVIAEAFGMRVYFYDVDDKLALGNAQSVSTMDDLLAMSDVVTLHVDGRPANAGFFGEREFLRMRPGSMFLNLSRGFLVDYAALREHILSGHIAGAAVDVFPVEPMSQGEAFDSVLRGLPNVILTPHIAGSTEEAQENIGHFVSAKVRDFLTDGTTTLSVNLPEVAMPRLHEGPRLAHLHRNVPGALATVNRLLSEHGVNIRTQALSTRRHLGYVLTDVEGGLTPGLMGTLRAMPETVCARNLP